MRTIMRLFIHAHRCSRVAWRDMLQRVQLTGISGAGSAPRAPLWTAPLVSAWRLQARLRPLPGGALDFGNCAGAGRLAWHDHAKRPRIIADTGRLAAFGDPVSTSIAGWAWLPGRNNVSCDCEACGAGCRDGRCGVSIAVVRRRKSTLRYTRSAFRTVGSAGGFHLEEVKSSPPNRLGTDSIMIYLRSSSDVSPADEVALTHPAGSGARDAQASQLPL